MHAMRASMCVHKHMCACTHLHSLLRVGLVSDLVYVASGSANHEVASLSLQNRRCGERRLDIGLPEQQHHAPG